jgi:hypothetical protein
MATKRSQIVMKLRKKTSDQIAFVCPKGGRELVRIAAVFKGVTSAEIWRRALLKYLGISRWISAEDAEDLKDVETPEEAKYALIHLRRKYKNAMAEGKQIS